MSIIRPSIFPPGVNAGISTRQGGVSVPPLGMNLSYKVGDDAISVAANRRIFFGSLGIPLDRLVIPGQVHGETVQRVEVPGEYPETDGVICREGGLFLCVTIADCVPVLLHDPHTGACAAVHAGWRGTALGILTGAVRALEAAFRVRPVDLLAFIGPSASECCYQVGEEVAGQIPPVHVSRRAGRPYVDLKGANRQQLLNSGLLPQHIETSPFCTISDSTLFHSHRRDGKKSGRMMGVIGLTA
jgi:polyphenol oxidase